MTMWSELKKYAPFAAAGGYAVVYMNKGWNYVLTDIQNITPEKLMAKWQNFAVAGVALVAVQFVAKAKLPVAVKTMLIVGLYFIAGHQIATAIDPPLSGSPSGSRMTYANHYAARGR